MIVGIGLFQHIVVHQSTWNRHDLDTCRNIHRQGYALWKVDWKNHIHVQTYSDSWLTVTHQHVYVTDLKCGKSLDYIKSVSPKQLRKILIEVAPGKDSCIIHMSVASVWMVLLWSHKSTKSALCLYCTTSKLIKAFWAGIKIWCIMNSCVYLIRTAKETNVWVCSKWMAFLYDKGMVHGWSYFATLPMKDILS